MSENVDHPCDQNSPSMSEEGNLITVSCIVHTMTSHPICKGTYESHGVQNRAPCRSRPHRRIVHVNSGPPKNHARGQQRTLRSVVVVQAICSSRSAAFLRMGSNSLRAMPCPCLSGRTIATRSHHPPSLPLVYVCQQKDTCGYPAEEKIPSPQRTVRRNCESPLLSARARLSAVVTGATRKRTAVRE